MMTQTLLSVWSNDSGWISLTFNLHVRDLGEHGDVISAFSRLPEIPQIRKLSGTYTIDSWDNSIQRDFREQT